MRRIASLLLTSSLFMAAVAHADPVACTDDKGHFLLAVPHDRLVWELFWGDGKTLVHSPGHPSGKVPGEWFLEPRLWNKENQPNWLGVDLRAMSWVDMPPQSTKCAIKCGEQLVSLRRLAPPEVKALMDGSKLAAAKLQRIPFALLEDERAGVFYLVDQGTTLETADDYRVFVGAKGKMKPTKVSKTAKAEEGVALLISAGKLKIPKLPQVAPTLEGKKGTLTLKRLPVAERLREIFAELGVYAKGPLGTPCDDLVGFGATK